MQGIALGVVEVVQEHDAGLRHHREDKPEPHERGGVDFATGRAAWAQPRAAPQSSGVARLAWARGLAACSHARALLM